MIGATKTDKIAQLLVLLANELMPYMPAYGARHEGERREKVLQMITDPIWKHIGCNKDFNNLLLKEQKDQINALIESKFSAPDAAEYSIASVRTAVFARLLFVWNENFDKQPEEIEETK